MIHRYDSRNCAVVVVDVQNDFCDPRGMAGQRGDNLGSIDAAIDRLEILIQAAREAKVPIVFVKTEHDDEVDSAPWRHRFQDGIGEPYEPAPPNCRTGTWGAEWYRIRPLYNDPVVTKHRYGAFSTNDFVRVVDELGRLSLLFAGIATNVCVETSARGAVDRDYLATIVRDASAAYVETEHAGSLATFGHHFGATPTVAEVTAWWAPQSPALQYASGRD